MSTAAPAARRSAERLWPDPSRVITTLFVPGQEGFDHQGSRTSAVLARVLALDDTEVEACLAEVIARFDGRHRDLLGVFEGHFEHIADRVASDVILSQQRRVLVGAVFTNEKTFEGAALCNPSIVAHPDQTGVRQGELRFAMSVRAISEGHRSSVGFRTGLIDADGVASVDRPRPCAMTGSPGPADLHAAAVRGELDRVDGGGENADYLLDGLGTRFTHRDLEGRLLQLERGSATRRHGARIASAIRSFAERTYSVSFDADTDLSERVLWPAMSAELHGLEDARFVRFTDDDGSVCYYAGYTAYDGDDIRQQLLHTTDFRTFTSSPLVGAAAANKGLALFPRRIDGRFVALTRADRESNGLAFSSDLHRWDTSVQLQRPAHVWEILQLGNCGSPIETAAGWLVLTHGVGPMRTYSIGAVLLDLDDPTKIVGQLRHPLLSPTPDEQDGYVPNVVYSCGSLVHADTLVLPYGIGDCSIGIATISLPELLGALCP